MQDWCQTILGSHCLALHMIHRSSELHALRFTKAGLLLAMMQLPCESSSSLGGTQHYGCTICRLEQLPESIGSASNLVKLQASFNNLQALPASLGKLPKLEMVRVAANCIAEVALAWCACSAETDSPAIARSLA